MSEKFEVTVITNEPQYPSSKLYRNKKEWLSELDMSLDIKRVSKKNRRFRGFLIQRIFLYFNNFIQLFKIIQKELINEKFSFIFVSTPPLSIPLLGIYAKFKFRAKLILDVRDLWPETLTSIKGILSTVIRHLSYPIEKKIYRSSDCIIVNSKMFTSYIRDIVKDDVEIIFLPNSLKSTEINQDKIYIKKEIIQIIYTGNIGIAQDLSIFLELADFFKENKNVKFVLMGYGIHREQIVKTIKEKDLSNISILRPETRKKTLKRLKQSDIAYLGLSNEDIFKTVIPGKLIDYMGAGLPIVGITHGVSKELIEEANAGIIFRYEDGIEKWVQQIEKLINCPELRKYYGENAMSYAEENFKWDKNKQLLGKAFEKLDE